MRLVVRGGDRRGKERRVAGREEEEKRSFEDGGHWAGCVRCRLPTDDSCQNTSGRMQIDGTDACVRVGLGIRVTAAEPGWGYGHCGPRVRCGRAGSAHVLAGERRGRGRAWWLAARWPPAGRGGRKRAERRRAVASSRFFSRVFFWVGVLRAICVAPH